MPRIRNVGIATQPNTREIYPEFHSYPCYYIYIYMYIRIAFSIELRLRVSRSLRSLANYRPSRLAKKPSNDVLACGDPITPSNTVKYHPSSNTLISTEQRGGVRNKYIYLLVMCSVSTNGERASLVNLKLTIGSLLECS